MKLKLEDVQRARQKTFKVEFGEVVVEFYYMPASVSVAQEFFALGASRADDKDFETARKASKFLLSSCVIGSNVDGEVSEVLSAILTMEQSTDLQSAILSSGDLEKK